MLEWLLPDAICRSVLTQADRLGVSCACQCEGHHDDAEGEDAIRFVEGLEELAHIDAALDADTNRWTLPNGYKLTALIFGFSSDTSLAWLGQALTSKDALSADGRGQHVSMFDSVQKHQSLDGSLALIHAAGFEKGLPTAEEAAQFLAETSLAAPLGISMFLYCLTYDKITEERLTLLIFLIKYVFDSSSLLNLYVIVTHAPAELLERRAAAAWVQRQAEQDPWFHLLYVLAGKNPSRFLLVESPVAPVSKKTREAEERRRNVARMVFQTFCDHPANQLVDFVMPMMQEVKSLAKAEIDDLLEKQAQVANLRSELRRRPYGRKVMGLSEGPQPAVQLSPMQSTGGPGLRSLLEQAEMDAHAAHDVLERKLQEVLRAPYFLKQVAVLVQQGRARFLQDLQSLSTTPGGGGMVNAFPLPMPTNEEEPPPAKVRIGVGLSIFDEICTCMAAANVEERHPCFIFDWDDTLCPTWWMRSAFPNATTVQETSATQNLKLALHAGRIEQVLRAARSFGFVDIVTLANRQWLEQTCRYLSAGSVDIMALLDELDIQVHHAQTRSSPKSGPLTASDAVQAKKGAMVHVLEKYYGDTVKARVHVLSFGDQDAEATAIQETVKESWSSSWQRPLCKVIRLPQDPDLQDLGKSLQRILTYLPALVRAESDLDLPITKLETMRW